MKGVIYSDRSCIMNKAEGRAVSKPIQFQNRPRNTMLQYAQNINGGETVIGSAPEFLRDRRTFTRVPLSTTVDLNAGDTLQGVATVRNVSRGGLCLRTNYPLAVGTPVQVDFDTIFFKGDPVSLAANVAWIEDDGAAGYKVGVQLLDQGVRSLAEASEVFYVAMAGRIHPHE